MLKKLLQAAIITFSISLFLENQLPSKPQTASSNQLEPPHIVVKKLLKQVIRQETLPSSLGSYNAPSLGE